MTTSDVLYVIIICEEKPVKLLYLCGLHLSINFLLHYIFLWGELSGEGQKSPRFHLKYVICEKWEDFLPCDRWGYR